ncbi:thiamine pyrophosphate enzyme, N-terminal TPP binding domain protein [Mycobacterium intracellulare 1956]|uniref:acetolactate synthase n=1 Tax=Mycobacterium intracellulare 1956 TaxID=1299331 RepID=X8CF75_MYCIT|nr:thiamine pyrophosphate enzyme, N-terminal TPP binding domain protein [Mycobacterium intracellulare 1956]
MTVPVYKRILDLFEAEGVNTLFGIPDPNFVHMFAEADARGWSVVAPHHELSAGFMAEAASRMTGKPGLCIGTLGRAWRTWPERSSARSWRTRR